MNLTKPQFLTLLENHIDLWMELFRFLINITMQHWRRPQISLTAGCLGSTIQRLFSIPTDSLCLSFIPHLREFVASPKFLDASKITRFKQDFFIGLTVFDKLVDLTELICRDIDNNLASMLLLDTSGIEAYVTENNPKYANRIIRQLKLYAKRNFDSSFIR